MASSRGGKKKRGSVIEEGKEQISTSNQQQETFPPVDFVMVLESSPSIKEEAEDRTQVAEAAQARCLEDLRADAADVGAVFPAGSAAGITSLWVWSKPVGRDKLFLEQGEIVQTDSLVVTLSSPPPVASEIAPSLPTIYDHTPSELTAVRRTVGGAWGERVAITAAAAGVAVAVGYSAYCLWKWFSDN